MALSEVGCHHSLMLGFQRCLTGATLSSATSPRAQICPGAITPPPRVQPQRLPCTPPRQHPAIRSAPHDPRRSSNFIAPLRPVKKDAVMPRLGVASGIFFSDHLPIVANHGKRQTLERNETQPLEVSAQDGGIFST